MTLRPTWERRSLHDMRRLSEQDRLRVVTAVERYADIEQGNIVRLQGMTPPTWRLRVGDYRALFHTEPAAADDVDRREWLVVERVLHRREAYR